MEVHSGQGRQGLDATAWGFQRHITGIFRRDSLGPTSGCSKKHWAMVPGNHPCLLSCYQYELVN